VESLIIKEMLEFKSENPEYTFVINTAGKVLTFQYDDFDVYKFSDREASFRDTQSNRSRDFSTDSGFN